MRRLVINCIGKVSFLSNLHGSELCIPPQVGDSSMMMGSGITALVKLLDNATVFLHSLASVGVLIEGS